MTGDLLPFAFEDRLVRVHRDENGDPWFVAKDICHVLGLGNHNDAISKLDDDEKGVANSDPLSPGGSQKMRTVSESGLYALIFRSRKPEARRFRKFVTAEVLPAIRKTGKYVAAGTETAELPPAYARLKTAERVRLLHCAVQAAKLDGEGSGAIMGHFARFCELTVAMSGDAPSLPTEAQALFDAWAEKNLEFESAGVERAKDLYASFVAWCAERGVAPPSWRRFGDYLISRFERRKSNVVYYHGIKLAHGRVPTM